MLKKASLLTAILAVSSSYLLPNTAPVKSSEQVAQERAQWIDDIRIFFNHAKQDSPRLEQEIAELEKKGDRDKKSQYYLNKLKANAKIYKVIHLLTSRDIKALFEATNEELGLSGGYLEVPGKQFKNYYAQHGECLVSGMLGCHTALGFAVCNAFLDTTPEDQLASAAMITLLTLKKLNGDTMDVVTGFWLKNKPEDTYASDYIGRTSLDELLKLSGLDAYMEQASPSRIQKFIEDKISKKAFAQLVTNYRKK